MKMHHKLISYSTSAIVFILLHDAKAQAVYTDIDPDVILDEDLETLAIDMDANGFNDFLLFNWSYESFSSLGDWELLQRIWAGPDIHDNAIAGSKYDVLYRYLPYALSLNSYISADLSFQTAFFQRMAFRSIDDFPPPLHGGNWYPEIIDHYLGVRFIDSNECNHYGWIRCDVMDEGRTLIIKDYAFETKCDVGILAGDIIGDTSVNVENINSIDANVYSFENNIYVDVKDINEKTEVYIYSISGDLIYTKTLSDLNTTISLALTKGIYLVNIVSNTGHYKKKLFIN